MSDTVIKVENLSKLYRLGVWGTGTLKDDIKKKLAKWTGRQDPTVAVGSNNQLDTVDVQEVWALQGINFEVRQGEVLGIIGKNGAGKSTLLKILSEITAPTTGAVNIKGRVASLLEVGTGMHPELTGRENIFLNGAILGMRRWEIKSKFDGIVEFAGIAKYIDTPIKRYSSGMRVRLGFAIAAFLEPEILIVDEVLAVGDAEFQRRAIGKMKEVSAEGSRTIIFVSHNMDSVLSLCSRSILLKNGGIINDGYSDVVVNSYLAGGHQLQKHGLEYSKDRSGTNDVVFSNVILEDLKGEIQETYTTGSSCAIVCTFKVNQIPHKSIDVGLSIHDSLDNVLSIFHSRNRQFFANVGNEGLFRIKCIVRNMPFASGTFYIKGRILDNTGTELDWPKFVLARFNIITGDFYRTGVSVKNGNAPILLKEKWLSYD